MIDALMYLDMPNSVATGFIVVYLLFIAAVLIFAIYCWWRVAVKCGYPGAYSLLLLIPLVNIVIQLIWVFTEWPIETELKRLRGSMTQPRT
jgi:hypothetical protein